MFGAGQGHRMFELSPWLPSPPLPPFTPHLTRQSFLLDCPPDGLFSISSLPLCLCGHPYLCIIPRPPLPFGLMLLPSFSHLSAQMFPPLPSSPFPPHIPSPMIARFLLSVMGLWFLPGADPLLSLPSLVAGKGVTSACSGIPQEFPSDRQPGQVAWQVGCLITVRA